MTYPLDALNRLDAAAFTDALGAVFEHSPWVAQAAHARRPFASVEALHAAMCEAVRAAGTERQVGLLRMHPELAGREAVAGTLTRDSTSEQGRLGFDALDRSELEHMQALNRRYRERFGFPCIVALRLHPTRASVIAEMTRRADAPPEAELAEALAQVFVITRGRLDRLVTEAAPASGLTTHVLDAVHGGGAPGMRVALYPDRDDAIAPLREGVTDDDGRLDLAGPDRLAPGRYRLVFRVAEYFSRRGVAQDDPPFLSEVPVVFGIAAGERHYHVPLLVSPWTYSTYRGGLPPGSA